MWTEHKLHNIQWVKQNIAPTLKTGDQKNKSDAKAALTRALVKSHVNNVKVP